MAKIFINDNFLLTTAAAERLFHDYAKNMPLYDYHSHLPIQQIVDDARFDNITKVWLYGDHYKWRAMRACGIPENLCSGIPDAADDYSRFEAWALTVPQTLCNPLYHWTHMELKRFFNIDKLLSPATAKEIYDSCNRQLATPEFSARSLIRRSNVKFVCTTDDPIDDLKGHRILAKEADWGCKVFPCWRPDKALAANDAKAFNAWLDKLEAASGKKVSSYGELHDALWARHQFFHDCGCRLSDYGIEKPYAIPYTESQAAAAFKKARGGTSLAGEELDQYRSAILFDLLVMDARQEWTQQLHFCAKRNNNSKAFALRGPDTGYDCIGDFSLNEMVALFDRLARQDALTKTIVYTLNPKDNELIVTALGSFQDGITPGKMQFGTAWWFNDQKDGMIRQMVALASIGLLSRFVGMETDSRSFLSYPRHEYFRRCLCQMLGTQMEEGELPGDYDLVGGMVKDICYNNALNYFKLGEK